MRYIKNPILRGFNPDPSIIRVGDDYYIATSTFEWYPGVQIHHSKDLVNWELVAHPLKRKSQLDMYGVPDSGGVWAPCLSYDNGIFYLVYTNVKAIGSWYLDTPNYVVTTKDITGEWSEPVYLNSDGFDPSLFHDDDGRKWLVNMVWDPRKGKTCFGGIRLQEYSPEEGKLIGEAKVIFEGTKIGITEAPHLYKYNGYYYLLTAEGGTHLGHASTMARSEKIDGPYEVDPENPILTSRNDVTLPLQRAGHGDIVETQNGEWYMVYLAGRPVPTKGRCILGRETCIRKMYWTEDKWLRSENGKNTPEIMVKAPDLPERKTVKKDFVDDFDSEILDINFQTLRISPEEIGISLTERPGYLRIPGRESLGSKFCQGMVARRQQAFCCSAETRLEFEPESYKQMAGLVSYYDTRNYYYIFITREEGIGKVIDIYAAINSRGFHPLDAPIVIPDDKGCALKADIYYDKLRFSYRVDGEEWKTIDNEFDQSTISDEACQDIGVFGCFTGAFLGMCCQDMFGSGTYADFDYFKYIECEDE